MVPGGAPTMLFAGIAAQSACRRQAGSALLASAFYRAVARLHALPAALSAHRRRRDAAARVGQPDPDLRGDRRRQPGSADFAQPRALGLALATIVATVVVAGTFRGTLGRLAVLIGLMAGATLGWALDAMPALADVARPAVHPSGRLPFGMPRLRRWPRCRC